MIKRVEEYLDEVSFPVPKKKIVNYAKLHHVPENILDALLALPEQSYGSLQEVKEALLTVPFDDGIPKKSIAKMEEEKVNEQQKMKQSVNLHEFTQMGDEENQESV